MLTQEVLLQLQKYNFVLLARQEQSGRQRLRYMTLADIKDDKRTSEAALGLRVLSRAVPHSLNWFGHEGLDRVTGIPQYESQQRLHKMQEKGFRQAVEQLQDRRSGGRMRGEDIRQDTLAHAGGSYMMPTVTPCA